MMDFIKQLWGHSLALRIVVWVAALGVILGIATADRSDSPRAIEPQFERPTVFDKIKKRFPGVNDSLPVKAERTVRKAVDVAEDVTDTAQKAVRVVDTVVQRTADVTDSVLKREP